MAQDNVRTGDEATQRILDPHRVETQRKAREEAESRLAARDITVEPGDTDADVADLGDLVEIFEAEVQRQGGDLMVNQLDSSEPQDPAFVPPRREPAESLSGYIERIKEQLTRLIERRLDDGAAR